MLSACATGCACVLYASLCQEPRRSTRCGADGDPAARPGSGETKRSPRRRSDHGCRVLPGAVDRRLPLPDGHCRVHGRPSFDAPSDHRRAYLVSVWTQRRTRAPAIRGDFDLLMGTVFALVRWAGSSGCGAEAVLRGGGARRARAARRLRREGWVTCAGRPLTNVQQPIVPAARATSRRARDRRRRPARGYVRLAWPRTSPSRPCRGARRARAASSGEVAMPMLTVRGRPWRALTASISARMVSATVWAPSASVSTRASTNSSPP